MASSKPAVLTFGLAQASQATYLASLINAAFRSERTGQTWLYDSQDKRVDIISPNDTGAMIEASNSVMLVGTVPGSPDPVATCFLRKPSSPPEAHMTSGAAWFGLLAVLPKYHGRGYGLAILEEAQRFVRDEWGVDRLEMDFVNTRVELRAWYERCGFQATGKRRDFPYGGKGREILRDGLDMLVLGKNLVSR